MYLFLRRHVAEFFRVGRLIAAEHVLLRAGGFPAAAALMIDQGEGALQFGDLCLHCFFRRRKARSESGKRAAVLTVSLSSIDIEVGSNDILKLTRCQLRNAKRRKEGVQ